MARVRAQAVVGSKHRTMPPKPKPKKQKAATAKQEDESFDPSEDKSQDGAKKGAKQEVKIVKVVPALGKPIDFGGIDLQPPSLEPSFRTDEELAAVACRTPQEFLDYLALGESDKAVCFPGNQQKVVMCLPADSRKEHCQIQFACLWCTAVQTFAPKNEGSRMKFQTGTVSSLANRHNHNSCPNKYNFAELVSCSFLHFCALFLCLVALSLLLLVWYCSNFGWRRYTRMQPKMQKSREWRRLSKRKV